MNSPKYLLKTFPDQGLLSIALDNDKNIDIEFLNAKQIDLHCTKDCVFYTGLWDNTNLQILVGENILKESIIVQTPESPREFSFKVTTDLTARIVENQVRFLDEQNNTIYMFETPFVILKNEEERHDPLSVSQSYDKENDIYSIKIGEFPHDQYPIIIDPTIVFPNNEAQENEAHSVHKNTGLYLTGSNVNGQDLGFANMHTLSEPKTDDPSQDVALATPVILGSDAVTFNARVLARMDLLSSTNQIPNIKSVNVSDNRKTTTIFNKKSMEFSFNASMSPVLLYVPSVNQAAKYSFSIKLSDTIKQFDNYSVTVELVDSPNGETITDSDNYGICSTPTKGQDETTYSFDYAPPATAGKSFVLVRTKLDFEYTIGNQAKSFSRVLYSYIQFVDQIKDYQKAIFQFRENASKVDFINGDFYAPTTNKGLVIIDNSLGIVRVIDTHCDIPVDDAPSLNVTCAGRIGAIERHTEATYTPDSKKAKDTVFKRFYKGVLVCTEGGAFYYDSHPFAEPAIYRNPCKISGKVFVDFTMSGPYLWLLDIEGKIYRIGYKHLLRKIVVNSDFFNDLGFTDISNAMDQVLDSANNQPFYENVSDHVSSIDYLVNGVVQTHYSGIYQPSRDGLPKKLIPFSLIPAVGTASQSNAASSAYETGKYISWHGVSFVYKDANPFSGNLGDDLTKAYKMVLSIAYAPVGKFKDAYNTYDTLYNYLDEVETDIVDSFPDTERQLNKVIIATAVDASPHESYTMNKMDTEDKPKISFIFDSQKDDSEQHNEIMLANVGPIYNANSRVIVGAAIPFNKETTKAEILEKCKPTDNIFHFCPQNVMIRDVDEAGVYYNPLTGEEITE